MDALVTPDKGLILAQKLASLYQAYPQVEAVTLSGSHTSGTAVDERSDIDLYVHLQEGEFPLEERRAIIAYNFPILRDMIPSYRYNVEKSLPRHDLVFINNEITWMLASYFDVLFAFNRIAHPGAKRLLDQAARLCPRLPQDLAGQVTEVLRLSTTGAEGLLAAIDALVDGLQEIIVG